MEGMQNWNGTIANALNEHIKELEPYMQSFKQLPILKEKVVEIIKAADLKREQDRQDALKIFIRINNYSHFLSTLGTYLSGIKVGRKPN